MALPSGWLNANPDDEFGVRMREAILERVRVCSRITVDAEIWQHMNVSLEYPLDNFLDQVFINFESTVFKEKLPPQTISKVVEFTKPVEVSMMQPRSPWQFWKENHRTGKWIGWFVRLLPEPEYETLTHTKMVRHSEKVTVDLQHSVIYPEAKAIADPRMGTVAIRWVEPVWK